MGWLSKAASGDFSGSGEDISENLGFGNRKGREAGAAQGKSRAKQRQETEGVLGKMTQDDDTYYNESKARSDTYKSGRDAAYNQRESNLSALQGQAQDQATNAQKTYTNDIQPRYRGMMESAQKEAGSAMTLSEAGDPNNAVQKGYRDLYNTEGATQRQMYNDEAQGVGKQGLQDAGVLAALGAQATAGQMGGAPMTGAQLQALQGQNQAQSGMAYARAQQKMNTLREQGLGREADSRSKGMDVGRDESDAQYGRGQDAKDRYRGSVGDFEGADDRNQQRQTGYRNENKGYMDERDDMRLGRVREDHAIDQGMGDLRYGQQQAQGGRKMGMINNMYGGEQAQLGAEGAQAAAGQAGKIGTLGSIAGAGIGAYGAMNAGGSAGAAAAGAAAGSGVAALTQPGAVQYPTANGQVAAGPPAMGPGVGNYMQQPAPQTAAYGGYQGGGYTTSPGAYGAPPGSRRTSGRQRTYT